MDLPLCVERAVIEALRPRPVPGLFGVLWVSGSLDGLRHTTVAIVGTRAASGYGRALGRRFARELAAAGCCVLSGLALGIDAAAHEGALEAGAATIGVLGGGHTDFFPRRNRGLAERMLAAGGGILSPFPPEQPARPAQFLQRNGVVAALADAVVVIEAPARSGALNTAGWAAGHIPVFAVPGDVDRPHVAGCHALIRDGATLARDPGDVLHDLGLGTATPACRAAARIERDPVHAAILSALRDGERSLEELAESCAMAPPKLLAALCRLDLDGAIEQRAGARYALCESGRR